MTVTQAKMGDNGSESGLADPPEQSITPQHPHVASSSFPNGSYACIPSS
jgi:hypothetical protein